MAHPSGQRSVAGERRCKPDPFPFHTISLPWIFGSRKVEILATTMVLGEDQRCFGAAQMVQSGVVVGRVSRAGLAKINATV